jgi:hypothetical protein
MNETNWQRLARIAEERRGELGLTQDDVHAIGGPSKSWQAGLASREGAPTTKMAHSLGDLDRALGWPVGTSWKLALDRTRQAFGEEQAEDEAACLVEMDSFPDAELPAAERRVRDFGTVVMGTLRNMDPASAERTMRDINRLLGIE